MSSKPAPNVNPSVDEHYKMGIFPSSIDVLLIALSACTFLTLRLNSKYLSIASSFDIRPKRASLDVRRG